MVSSYKIPCFVTSDHLNIEYNEKTNPRWKIWPSYVMLQKSCWFSYPTHISHGSNTLLIMILRLNRRTVQSINFVTGFPGLNFFISIDREQNSATSLLSVTHKWLIMMVWIRPWNGPPGPAQHTSFFGPREPSFYSFFYYFLSNLMTLINNRNL